MNYSHITTLLTNHRANLQQSVGLSTEGRECLDAEIQRCTDQLKAIDDLEFARTQWGLQNDGLEIDDGAQASRGGEPIVLIQAWVIQCHTLVELVRVCAELIPTGVTFKADTMDLTVNLTGGY